MSAPPATQVRSFRLEAPLASVFPLFTAEGERSWAPGWEPVILSGAVERGIDHLVRVLDTTGCRVIMDHHALRDGRFSSRFERLWQTGRVVTAAAHLGAETQPLEARRDRLWAAVRKPPAKARDPRATIAPDGRRVAKGGRAE